jgi:hypothetical protein
MRHHLPALALAGALLLTGAACSDDDQDDARDTATSLQEEAEDAVSTASSAAEEGTQDAAEAAARNLASEHGEDEFDAAGHDIEGDLSCEADASEGGDAIDITCTGTTDSGGAAELTGTTSELPGASATELEGDFTGTVDGEEVFTTDRLGGDD